MRIKPIVWVAVPRHPRLPADALWAEWAAQTGLGEYYVRMNSPDVYLAWLPNFEEGATGHFSTEAEAKAYCEADYLDRVRACLED